MEGRWLTNQPRIKLQPQVQVGPTPPPPRAASSPPLPRIPRANLEISAARTANSRPRPSMAIHKDNLR